MGYVKTYRNSKNLFDKSNADIYDSTLIDTGSSKWNKYDGTGKTVRIPVSPSTNYAISIDLAIETSVFRVLAVSTSDVPIIGSPVSGITLMAQSEDNTAIFTTDTNTLYIVIQFTSAVFDNCVNSLMLVNGSVPYKYEAYNITAWYDFCELKTASGWTPGTPAKAPF